MKRPLFRRCGTAPGALSPKDQAVLDEFRAMLAAVRTPKPWTPGNGRDVAVRVGPFIERAHARPGDDHGPDLIAVTLVHPDTPHAAAYLHGHQLGYTGKGWLRCEATAILDTWQPAYTMLTHAAANLPLPDDVGMAPARYGVHVEARRADGTGHTLLRLGPYFQTWVASHDADHLNNALAGRAATVIPGVTVTAKEALFDISDHESYTDPYLADVTALLTDALAGGQETDDRRRLRPLWSSTSGCPGDPIPHSHRRSCSWPRPESPPLSPPGMAPASTAATPPGSTGPPAPIWWPPSSWTASATPRRRPRSPAWPPTASPASPSAATPSSASSTAPLSTPCPWESASRRTGSPLRPWPPRTGAPPSPGPEMPSSPAGR
ncbi:hypothetical protein ACIQ9E_06780 [Streptomyces sp. NPDC094448]|uniref:hypothetical protein n=1 Tax=Streptomyces sp. NPDC094448 TaxID=3366063 RepID=UPI003800CBF9